MKLTRLAAAAGLLLAVGATGVATAGSASAYPNGTLATAQINATVFPPSGQVVVTVQNTTPGPITLTIQSAPVTIGTSTVGSNGQGVVTGKIPAGYSGPHTIVAYGAGNEIFPFQIRVTSGGGTNGGGGSGTGDTNGGGLANTGAAVTGIGILGGVLVAGGVFFVVAGRRRTANQTPSV